jgi:subtilisin family serine protease
MKKILVFLLAAAANGQFIPNRYIVELGGDSAAIALSKRGIKAVSAKRELSAERLRVQAAQTAAREAVLKAGGRVTGSVDIAMNALFVEIPDEKAASLSSIPGVVHVYRDQKTRAMLNRALPLASVPNMWALLPNGQNSAGAGAKIAIFDSGVAVYHAAFQDSSLTAPSGFPVSDNSTDASYTSNKIIVAANYTDDPNADDWFGHGTAIAMAAAGVTNNGPLATITGVAPKAFIGNFKVLDSTGSGDISWFIQALSDAMANGFTLGNYSAGASPALPAASDPGAVAVEQAYAGGFITVIASGDVPDSTAAENNGVPAAGTISSPAQAPDAVSVGASESDRQFYDGAVSVTGQPDIYAEPGDTSFGGSSVTGPLADVSTLDPTKLACTSLPSGSLNGKVALILRGTCSFESKLNNVQNAGAIAGIIYTPDNQPAIAWTQGAATLPGVLIAQTDAQTLLAELSTNSSLQVTVTFYFTAEPQPSQALFPFSGSGPSVDMLVKPDLVAVGDPVYTATQTANPDPSTFYDPSGYTILSGTSLSTALVTGAMAAIQAAQPSLTAAQVISKVVNSANAFKNVNSNVFPVEQAGAGSLNLLNAYQSSLALSAKSLSFGVVSGSVNNSLPLTLTNVSGSNDTYTVSATTIDGGLTPTIDKSSVSVAGGASQQINITLNGNSLAAGVYDGLLLIKSSVTGVETHVPWWAGVAGTSAQNIAVLYSDGSDAAGAEAQGAILFNVTDIAGLPYTAVAPAVTATSGGGSVVNVTPVDTVNAPGVYSVDVNIGPGSGTVNVFQITAGSASITVGITGQ